MEGSKDNVIVNLGGHFSPSYDAVMFFYGKPTYTLKNAGLFFQPKCWVETAGLGLWVVLTQFWVENWSWS